MTEVDVWHRIFRATYSAAKPAVVTPPAIVAHYARFFRGHHGPCTVRWSDVAASWEFSCCPHRDAEDVCQVHQGFLLGLLDASVGLRATLSERRRSPEAACCLTFSWTKP